MLLEDAGALDPLSRCSRKSMTTGSVQGAPSGASAPATHPKWPPLGVTINKQFGFSWYKFREFRVKIANSYRCTLQAAVEMELLSDAIWSQEEKVFVGKWQAYSVRWKEVSRHWVILDNNAAPTFILYNLVKSGYPYTLELQFSTEYLSQLWMLQRMCNKTFFVIFKALRHLAPYLFCCTYSNFEWCNRIFSQTTWYQSVISKIKWSCTKH